MAEKPHMNLVFIGHVDHGKSTTVGRILYDSKAIDEQTMKKLKEKAKRNFVKEFANLTKNSKNDFFSQLIRLK